MHDLSTAVYMVHFLGESGMDGIKRIFGVPMMIFAMRPALTGIAGFYGISQP